MCAGTLNDLYVFDLSNSNWTDLTQSIVGDIPSARYGHGFASAGGKIYLHGGSSSPGL